MSQQHIIGRTILEIDIDRLDEVWNFQNDISDLLQQRVVPEMARLFDQLVSVDEIVRLDQVVVIVDPINRRFLADEFVRNVIDALSKALSDRLGERLPEVKSIRRDRTSADWEVLLYFLKYGRLPWWSLIGDWTSWLTRWETVMQTESHWQKSLRDLLISDRITRQRLVAQFSEGFRHQLVFQLQPTWSQWSNLLSQARQMMQSMDLSHRACHQLDTQAWLLLLEELGREQSPTRPLPTAQWIRAWLPDFIQTVRSELTTTTPISQSLDDSNTSAQAQPSQIVTTNITTNITGNITGDTIGNITGKSIRNSEPLLAEPSTWAIAYQRWRILIETFSITEKSLWLEAIAQIIPSLSTNQTSESLPQTINPTSQDSREAQTDLALPQNDIDLASQNLNITLEPISEDFEDAIDPYMEMTQAFAFTSDTNVETELLTVDILRQVSNSQISTEEESTGIFVNQSGLVILHPFLRLYFEDVGLLNGETFRDEIAQQTAIYLLHYLATGQTEAPEYELVLPKLLCGWALSEPIARELTLPEQAITEAENLLQAVINYWSVLKSTSPDGLREGFLQRAGKLTRLDEGDWRLQVEQSAIDVLFGSLPWGMNVVKLPWMENLLMVEWS